ncbi:MAG: hypothetical protein QM754_06655 [Tepidisphaeraceae bacterium]
MASILRRTSCLIAALLPVAVASAQAEIGKTVYIPAKVWKVPAGNDYANAASEFCNQRTPNRRI